MAGTTTRTIQKFLKTNLAAGKVDESTSFGSTVRALWGDDTHIYMAGETTNTIQKFEVLIPSLLLILDGVTVDTVALAGASVPDNANDWEIMSDAVSYMGSFTIEVSDATVAENNPTSIVRGSTYDTGTVT
jgi:hypothetical protein